MSIAEAFASPITRALVFGMLAVLAAAAAIIGAITLARVGSPAFRRELWLRLGSWLGLLPIMVVPVLLGRVWLIAAVTLLGLVCLREYSRATGLFREKLLMGVAVLGLLAVNFAALDHWYNFFVALPSLTVSLIAVATIPQDRPGGYIQRTALAIFGFMLFGSGLAHLGYMANEPGYRPIVLMLLLLVSLNDVLAFTFGKLAGGAKLLARTSPGKTASGAVGALIVTSAALAVLAHYVFEGSAMDDPATLAAFGLWVGIAAQAADLMLSSIKRDLGIKDMGVSLPGHGGVLDRFNSLLLVAPVAFHFIYYHVGLGLQAPTRVITGS